MHLNLNKQTSKPANNIICPEFCTATGSCNPVRCRCCCNEQAAFQINRDQLCNFAILNSNQCCSWISCGILWAYGMKKGAFYWDPTQLCVQSALPPLPLLAAWHRRSPIPRGDGGGRGAEEAQERSRGGETDAGRTGNRWKGQKEARAPASCEAASKSTWAHQNAKHAGRYGYQLQRWVRALSDATPCLWHRGDR